MRLPEWLDQSHPNQGCSLPPFSLWTYPGVFVNRQYFLIDFLDSYIESPILDLAKIAQETKLLWTSRLMLETHDASKYQIAMKTIDVGIQEYFRKYDWFIKYQTIFEFQNLIRLLPYVRDHKIAQLITSRLHVLMRT